MSEETQTNTPAAVESTQADTQGAPDTGSVEGALRALAESKGFAYGDTEPPAPSSDAPDPDEAKPAPAAPPAEAPRPAAAAKEVPLDKYARMEAKAREQEANARTAQQELAALRQRVAEEESAWKADPLQALHRRGLSTTDLNKRALDLGEPKPDAPAEELPAWAQEIKRENDALKQWRDQQTQAQQQVQQQAALAHQTNVLKDHLGKFDEFSLVNDLDGHGEVLKRISTHLAGGRFEDDEQAATVIAAIAREYETELQTKYRAELAKPKLRAFLERELRGQSEAKPARQEPQGNRGSSNTARPAANEGHAPRTTARPTTEEVGWSREDAMQRALDESRPLMRASS